MYITQPFLKGRSRGSRMGASVVEVGVRREDRDLRGGGRLLSLGFSSDESFLSPLVLPRSNDAPGVLGVLLGPPKPKAPLPSPKDAAPALVALGEARSLGELKGLRFPWLLKLPIRLFEGASWLSLRSGLFVERESLPLLWVLLIACSISRGGGVARGVRPTLLYGSRGWLGCCRCSSSPFVGFKSE